MAGRRGVFYGWYVVASCFVALAMSYGTIYASGAFFTTLERTFDASRTELAGLFSVAIGLAAGLGIVTGRIADRVGPRPVVLAGGVLIGVGMLLASRSGTLWQLYASYGVGVGLGTACIIVPATGAVQHWFVRRRGFASGLAVAGVGAGNLIAPPLTAALIRWDGWRTAFVVLGALAFVGIAAAAFFVQRSPEERGLRPDGDPPDAGGAPAVAETGVSVSQALGTRAFRLLYAAVLTGSLGMFVPFAHLVPDAEARGISAARAAWLLGLIGAGSIGGRLVLGGSADRFGRRLTLIGSLAGMAAAMGWWLAADSMWSLALFAVVFGVAYGTFASLVGALASDYFGVAHAGEIIGALYTGVGLGSLIGPPVAGYLYEQRDSYTVAIAVAAVMVGIATVCALLLPEPKETTAHVHRV